MKKPYINSNLCKPCFIFWSKIDKYPIIDCMVYISNTHLHHKCKNIFLVSYYVLGISNSISPFTYVRLVIATYVYPRMYFMPPTSTKQIKLDIDCIFNF